ELLLTRRQLFGRAVTGVGIAALASLLQREGLAQPAPQGPTPKHPEGTRRPMPTASRGVHPLDFASKAKNVVCLHMSGGPSHIDLFDYKPKLREHQGEELPASVRMGQRITGMTSGQKSFPCAAPIFDFKQHGKCGAWLSELLPHLGNVADEICIIRSMHTEAINHDPAITYIQTGAQQPGRPSIGAWLSYGLGTENQNLPAYIVLISLASNGANDQPLFGRLWGSGFLPSVHQGVKLRSNGA